MTADEPAKETTSSTALQPLGQQLYDPKKADRSISPQELVKDKRFWQVSRTLTLFVAGSISEKYGKDTSLTTSEKRKKRSSRVRQALIELGPTFIKLGQFLSVRRDILSDEMADELALLQDKVPPFDVAIARKIIEMDLGAPPEKLFAKFEETPIASASIGQVHRAWLQDGTPVVVKVQRPDLATRFYQDLGYMRLATRLGGRLKKSTAWDDWLQLSDEFGRTLFQEINYLQEGKNADRLRQILKGHPEIRVPRIFWKFAGKRVLTLEYIPGIKVSDTKALEDSGLDLVAIGNRLVSCYLDQVLLHGFFHADPHAGNLAIDDWGNVVLYDFGMIGEITDAQRDAITGCIAAVIRRDIDDLIVHLKILGIVKENAKTEPVRRAIEPLIDYYAGKGLRELDFSHLESDIDQIADERAIYLPPTLAYLIRTGTALEGVARTLHPNFSFVEAAKPSIRKWILNKPDQAANVLKLMGGEYANALKAAWLKLINAKTLDNSLSFLQTNHPPKTQSEKSRSSSAVPATTAAKQPSVFFTQEDVKAPAEKGEIDQEMSALLQQLDQVKSRVNTLEKEIGEFAQNRVNLLVQSMWLLAFSILYLGTCLITELRPYSIYFLIGNGFLVARIIGHLVRSSKLRGRSGTTELSRRQRR
ncbi:AarF/ABC1/UbiB kinase family protein [Candidatus Obscuribacterales bacterium]|nr:AarF/ABC1/UbiB kinase family protein [Candidatus Obscuribacterales bacterium]MBX3148531.1 AarF/ABC1/UbiB kinase family protein [Candidatus Obscuribacterales bacterium]